MSSDRSATIFFSRAFSCSSSLSRFISDGIRPAYFFFQLKNVAELIPAFLQTSATGVPSSASNERSVVPADIGDRRWQVFEVSDEHREDKPYFSAIMREMKEGGYEAMLHELLERDISKGPDPRKTIRTPELFDQIIQAQGPVEKYIYQFLDSGYLPQPEAQETAPA